MKGEKKRISLRCSVDNPPGWLWIYTTATLAAPASSFRPEESVHQGIHGRIGYGKDKQRSLNAMIHILCTRSVYKIPEGNKNSQDLKVEIQIKISQFYRDILFPIGALFTQSLLKKNTEENLPRI